LERASNWAGDKQLLVRGDELWVPGKDHLFVLDRHTGAVKHRLGNVVLGSAAMQPLKNGYSLATPLNDGLYLGSTNGTFMRMPLPSLSKSGG
jgi:hypothetical protein